MTTPEVNKTLDFQSKLPPLPLPSLEETCAKYLESVEPFLTKKQFEETKNNVLSFQNGIGKKLQEKLQAIADSSRNWHDHDFGKNCDLAIVIFHQHPGVQDWWYDSYLDYRGPLPLLSSIAGGYESITEFDKPKQGSNIQRGAQWIHAMTQIYLEIVRQDKPVQLLAKQFPMDMTQYLNFFCGGRIPGEKKDTQVHYIHSLTKGDGSMEVIARVKHIVVLMKGRVFCLKVIDDNDQVLHPDTIEKSIRVMMKLCDNVGEGDGVAALTIGQRDTWYKAYKHLCILDRQNKININVINEAIFAFSFEDVDTYDLQMSSEHGILGGDNNRWADKTCNAVISNTGIIVSSEDHIHFDGNVGVGILQDAADYLHKHQYNIKVNYPAQKVEDVIELKFVIDDHIRDIISDNVTKHKMLTSALDMIDKPVNGFGKAFAKVIRINPDTIMQMAIQLAYYSLHKRCVSTYESATTRMFYNGRTETVRSCTNESKAWCVSMFDDNKTVLERKELFMRAVKKHDQLMRDACQGKGIDRHLFGLKKVCEREELPIPKIFTDEAYKMSGGDGNFVISSSLSGFTILHGGMSPMVEDGYGTFYNINTDVLQLFTSAWKTSSDTNNQKFYDAIVTSLHTIKDMCLPSKY